MKVQAIRGWHDPHVRARPVPPIADFEDWMRRRNRIRNANCIPAQTIRRAVIMRRQGETWSDIARATGRSACALRAVLEFLPLELQP